MMPASSSELEYASLAVLTCACSPPLGASRKRERGVKRVSAETPGNVDLAPRAPWLSPRLTCPSKNLTMAKRDRDGDDEMADAGAMEGGNPDAEAMLIEKFLAAVKAGDADTTRACLAEDADLVTLEDNDTQWSPLHHGALPNCRTPFLNVQSPAPAHPNFFSLLLQL